jgi:hypothetical protein
MRLSEVAYLLLGIGPKEGRLAVREPRTTDRFDMIRDLLELKAIKVETDLVLLRDALESAARQRDQLGHGIWLRDRASGILYLRLTKGSWQPVKGQAGKIKRLVRPEGVEYTASDCRELRAIIIEAIEMVRALEYEIEGALRASPKKSQPQPQPTGQP